MESEDDQKIFECSNDGYGESKSAYCESKGYNEPETRDNLTSTKLFPKISPFFGVNLLNKNLTNRFRMEITRSMKVKCQADNI